MDLRKDSIIHWCCHFQLATDSLSYMACSFTTSARVNSNGLCIKQVDNNWRWCWASANFTICGSLSSTSKEYKDFASRSNLGRLFVVPRPYQPILTICRSNQSDKYWGQNACYVTWFWFQVKHCCKKDRSQWVPWQGFEIQNMFQHHFTLEFLLSTFHMWRLLKFNIILFIICTNICVKPAIYTSFYHICHIRGLGVFY